MWPFSSQNTDSDKYKYSGFNTRFDAGEKFSLPDGSIHDKNVILFGADMISLLNVDNKSKNILILSKGRKLF